MFTKSSSTTTEMDQQQVLIHFAAPSRLRDDKRYASVANQLKVFKVASVRRVYDFVGLASRAGSDDKSTEAQLHFYRVYTAKEAQLRELPLSSRIMCQEIQVEATPIGAGPSRTAFDDSFVCSGDPNSEAIIRETPTYGRARGYNTDVEVSADVNPPKVRRRGQWVVTENHNVKKRPQAENLWRNPPFKNPFHGRPSNSVRDRTLQISEVHRPRTVSTIDTGIIDVPRTLPHGRKRAASDSVSSGSFVSASFVSDSQPSFVLDDKVRQRCYKEKFTTDPLILTTRTCGLVKQHLSKRLRLGISDIGDNNSIMEDAVEADDRPATSMTSCFNKKRLLRPPPGCQGPYFLRNRSEDWTSPPGPSASETSSEKLSTLSPSQPLPLCVIQAHQSHQPSSPAPPLMITLTSGHECSFPVQQGANQTISDVAPTSIPISSSCSLHSDRLNFWPIAADLTLYPSSSPLAERSVAQGIHLQIDNTQKYLHRTIQSLPDIIQPPLPAVSSDRFRTYVSKHLAEIVHRLPLSTNFRPVHVLRDVRIGERGHWSIRVRISTPQEVAQARKARSQAKILAAMNDQFAFASTAKVEGKFGTWKQPRDVQSQMDRLGLLKRQDIWTENEFVVFYKRLETFVQEGKAGHHVSVVKDWLDDAGVAGISALSRYARIRVYTMGEVVGHMWLALFVLSNKIIQYIPLEWIASDEAVVVRMSGQRNKGGKLGPWTPKGSLGEHGGWEVASGTPPRGQGKVVVLPSS